MTCMPTGRIAPEAAQDPVLYGECLGGALYTEDFRRIAAKAGFPDCRVVEGKTIEIGDEGALALVRNASFASITYRLFKIDGLEDACEDYGQAVRYKGGIPGFPFRFDLDNGHGFEKGRVFPVCANTFMMLEKTRFAKYFDFFGDMTERLGLFADCGNSSFDSTSLTDSSCC